MRMAINELNSLCRSALEGSGWAQGDMEDAADAAVWLQASGLDGMNALDALLGAERQEACSADAQPSDTRHADAATTSPCAGLAGCLLAFELAWARATRSGAATVRVSNALSPRLALFGLKTMCARGRRFDLTWTDGTGRHFASTSGHHDFPDYLGFSAPAAATAQEIMVRCVAEGTATALHAATDEPLTGAVDREELEARYREGLWRGIDVETSHLERLKAWKEKVLVPATQASREHGAGGADDGF